MKGDFLNLFDLQKIDNEIDELYRIREAYPLRIDKLDKELTEAKLSLEEEKNRVTELEKNARHFEREMQRAADELEKHRARLYEVKTNKEYDAVQLEIEAWRNSVDQNETEILQTMSELDNANAEAERKTQLLEDISSTHENEITELQSKLASIDEEVEKHEIEREKVKEGIDRRILAAYERIRKRKGGLAVVPVVRNACGGCNIHLPPQKVVEIKGGNNLIYCENCGRIMVWNEEIY